MSQQRFENRKKNLKMRAQEKRIEGGGRLKSVEEMREGVPMRKKGGGEGNVRPGNASRSIAPFLRKITL